MFKNYLNQDKHLNVQFYESFLPLQLANELYELLVKAQYNSDTQSSVFIYGSSIKIPRSQVAYGDEGTSYKFAGHKVNAKSWSTDGKIEKILRYIKNRLESTFRTKLNYVLINKYANGDEYIGYHKDNQKDLGKTPKIFGISLGATRQIYFKYDIGGEVVKINLPNNSLVIMNDPTNKKWKHSIPKKPKITHTRISLTFRYMT